MGFNRLIYIRTDGNSQIASGHLVRCFSIALACHSLGMEVCFLVSDEESEEQLIHISGTCGSFPVYRLKTSVFNHLEQELPEVVSLLKQKSGYDIVFFLDSYYITEKYLSSLNALVKTAYLDDLQLFDYPVSLLVNYDVISDDRMPSYKEAYQNSGHLLLGAAYTPLRPQFQSCRMSVRETVSDILVTTGGSDPYHFCLKLMQYLSSLPGFPDSLGLSCVKFHIVIGKWNTDKEILLKLADTLSSFQLHENVSDMASLMQGCDLAVSAAGTTLYELSALGIPTVSFTMADNQLTSAQAFAEAGAVPCAGDIRTSPEKVFQEILNFISFFSFPTSASCSRRKTAQAVMNNLVDGKGAWRIAKALKEL